MIDESQFIFFKINKLKEKIDDMAKGPNAIQPTLDNLLC